jgi:hypothetical protein
VDTEIALTRTDNVIMAETRKQRDMPTGNDFAYLLHDVEIGLDEDGAPVSSAVVQPTEPVKKRPSFSQQQKIGLQALDDALTKHGKKKGGELLPMNRRCVELATWRSFCDSHELSGGQSDSAQRKAFHSVKQALKKKRLIRIVEGWVWRCEE